MKENEDYVLVPFDGDDDSWQIRILTGQFAELVYKYKAIGLNESRSHLTFNYEIIFSPNDEITEEDQELQTVIGKILSSILESALDYEQNRKNNSKESPHR